MDPQRLREAHALSDPRRAALFEHLLGQSCPLDVAALTAAGSLSHQMVRKHLAVLVEAGLVVGTTEPRQRPGRPRILYVASPSARGRWGDVDPYEELALMLVEVLTTGDNPVDVGRRRVGGVGHVLDGAGGVAAMVDELVGQGVDPRVVPADERSSGDRTTMDVALGRCPFERAAVSGNALVCALHRGVAEGLADRVGGVVVAGLEPSDPRSGGCTLHLVEAPTA